MAIMVVTILGSGTGVPDGDRNSAGYFLALPSARLMLDCGAGTVHALARFKLPWQTITHLFISHFHVDHVGELASLMFAFKWGREGVRTEPLTLIGPRGLGRLVTGLNNAYDRNLLDSGFPVTVTEIAPDERFPISDNCSLSVAKTPHTSESLAVRIDAAGRSICYTGDTAYSETVSAFFKDTDLMISECSFPERRQRTAHLAIKDVARMAQLASAKSLVVTHFYFPVDERRLLDELRQDYSGEIFIGRDGMKLEV
jgi:ribonuclease BN (tRNA processing enzyme)